MTRTVLSALAALTILALTSVASAAPKTCLDGKIEVSVPAGVNEQGNTATACRHSRFSSADYAVFHYNIYKNATALTVQQLAALKLGEIQTSTDNKNIQVVTQGPHGGNPLSDYIIILTYHRDVKVAHDLRRYYYKRIIYSFGKGAKTRLYADLYVQNEIGNKIEQLYNSEKSKFFSFINSIKILNNKSKFKLKNKYRIPRKKIPQHKVPPRKFIPKKGARPKG